jgi:outer membrane protease
MRGASVFFMLLSAGFLYAQKNLSVSVETGGGILFGETYEYVISESGKVVSRLDWQENRIPYSVVIPNTTGKTSAGKTGAVENEMKKSSDGSKFESENWHVEFTVKLSR